MQLLSLSLIETLGLNYCLGVDGLSLPLVVLTALLTWIAIYSSNESVARPLLYFDIAGKCRGCRGFPGSKLAAVCAVL